jgi:hypothetical protein
MENGSNLSFIFNRIPSVNSNNAPTRTPVSINQSFYGNSQGYRVINKDNNPFNSQSTINNNYNGSWAGEKFYNNQQVNLATKPQNSISLTHTINRADKAFYKDFEWRISV